MGEEVSATIVEQKQAQSEQSSDAPRAKGASETKAETQAEAKPEITEETKTETATETKTEKSAETKPKKRIVKSTISVKKQRKEESDKKEVIEKPAKKQKEQKENPEELKRKKFSHLKLFNRWPMDVTVSDLGLRPYVNLTPVVVPWSAGRNIKKQFWKSKKSIIERLMLKLMVAGHRGKKHFRTSNVNTGKLATQYAIIKRTFELIEQRTKKNPVEVLVRALEVGSPREGVTYIEYGGVRYPKAADMAPQRRLDLCLRWMSQAAFVQSAKGKKHVWVALADEITATANNDTTKSNCLTKRQDLERQSGASR